MCAHQFLRYMIHPYVFLFLILQVLIDHPFLKPLPQSHSHQEKVITDTNFQADILIYFQVLLGALFNTNLNPFGIIISQ